MAAEADLNTQILSGAAAGPVTDSTGAPWLVHWDTAAGDPRLMVAQEARDGTVAPLQQGAGNGQQAQGYAAGFASFAGYLFDREQWAAGDQATDAACVATAYARHGTGMFDVLRGGFALVIWDAAQRRLIAGRDAIGLHPCYYFWDGRHFLLSADIELLLAQPQVDGRVNRVVLAEYLQGHWPAHQRQETFYEAIRRLPGAHHLALGDGRLTLERYWDPLPPGFEWATEAELARFEPLLEQAVGRCLRVGADSIALSGGFDSVSLAVLAAEQRQDGPPLHAISLRFVGGAVDEGSVQQAVAQALGMPQTMRTTEEFLRGFPLVEASLSLSRTSPLPVLSLWQSMYSGLLEAASALGLSKMMMGTGGDEMFGVDLSYGADRLAALDLAGVWRFYRAMVRTSPFSPLHVARWVFWHYAVKLLLAHWARQGLEWLSPTLTDRLRRRHLDVAEWVAPEDATLRQALRGRRLHPFPEEEAPEASHYNRALRGLVQAPLLMAEMEQSFSWARRYGFTLLLPYLDRDVVGLSLRMHPEFLVGGGRAKTPLRRMVRQRLQGVALPAKKVDFTLPVHDFLRDHGRRAWQKLGGAMMLEELGVVSSQTLQPLMDGYFREQNDNWLRTWSVLSAETWLRSRPK